MRAMILAAGAGTRLAPLTNTTPKVLVPVLGVPMLERLAAFLGGEGVGEMALNLHHLPHLVAAHLEKMAARPFPPIRSFREPVLLGTGGGVANVADFWGQEPLLVWNGDVLADLAPARLLAHHAQSGALATLVTQQRPVTSFLLVDGAGQLCGVDAPRRGGRQLVREPTGSLEPVAFQGISAFSPALLPLMARPGAFDLIDALLAVAAQGHPVGTMDAGEGFWGSTGTPGQLAALEQALAVRPALLARWTPAG